MSARHLMSSWLSQNKLLKKASTTAETQAQSQTSGSVPDISATSLELSNIVGIVCGVGFGVDHVLSPTVPYLVMSQFVIFKVILCGMYCV